VQGVKVFKKSYFTTLVHAGYSSFSLEEVSKIMSIFA
jgi:hypothetical protein